MPADASLLTAVDTKTRSPHTIGLETATPATGVLHRTFSPVAAFHVAGVGAPSATPDAPGPRNDGQFCADAPAAADIVQHSTRVARRIITCLSASRPPPSTRSPRRPVSC